MALVMTPIYTQTVGSGGTSQIIFNNIPQFYTDLLVMTSIRTTVASIDDGVIVQFNGDTASNYSNTALYGAGGAGVGSFRATGTSARISYASGASATANTFGSGQAYIPNYATSNFKSWIVDALNENNANATTFQTLVAGLWRSSSAITSIRIASEGFGNFVQHSTFSLYGIIRSGA